MTTISVFVWFSLRLQKVDKALQQDLLYEQVQTRYPSILPRPCSPFMPTAMPMSDEQTGIKPQTRLLVGTAHRVSSTRTSTLSDVVYFRRPFPRKLSGTRRSTLSRMCELLSSAWERTCKQTDGPPKRTSITGQRTMVSISLEIFPLGPPLD